MTRRKNKRRMPVPFTNNNVKFQPKKDRISDLPDPIIQHILSFLPSTKEAIRTTVLSKRWYNQWKYVLVLKFYSGGMYATKFSRFIDKTLLLHDTSKIKKFHIQSNLYNAYYDKAPPDFDSNLRFAIAKDVEELILKFRSGHEVMLPEFLFNNANSLVKLQTHFCNFTLMRKGMISSFGCLKTLNIKDCRVPNGAIENILSASPSLESLELTSISRCDGMIIASESLKKILLKDTDISALQIHCPNLEELKLFGSLFPTILNCPSLICANLNFENHRFDGDQIFLQLQHVEELKFGSLFIHTLLHTLYTGFGASISSLLLKNKSLTLNNPDFEKQFLGIARALEFSSVLKKLVIKLPVYKKSNEWTTEVIDFDIFSSKAYWNSFPENFFNSMSHLKTVEIKGLSQSNDNYKFVLNFVEFLLKNAKVLEKLALIVKDGGNDFVTELSQKLVNFPNRSQHVVVEVLCSH